MFGLDPDIQVYKTSIFKLESLNKPEDDSTRGASWGSLTPSVTGSLCGAPKVAMLR